MRKNLQWKLLAIIAVIVLSVLAIYPPAERIRLGLDLEGGVHMVLLVQTDDALRVETETAAEQLGEQLGLQGIAVTSVVATDPMTIRIEGVQVSAIHELHRVGLLHDRRHALRRTPTKGVIRRQGVPRSLSSTGRVCIGMAVSFER